MLVAFPASSSNACIDTNQRQTPLRAGLVAFPCSDSALDLLVVWKPDHTLALLTSAAKQRADRIRLQHSSETGKY